MNHLVAVSFKAADSQFSFINSFNLTVVRDTQVLTLYKTRDKQEQAYTEDEREGNNAKSLHVLYKYI
jgi:hypothetical protein